MGVALHRQAGFWSDNVKLWTHTLEVTGPNYMVEDNLASALLVEGRDEEGFPHLLRARALRPDDPGATLNIANYQRLHGHYQEALEGYARVLQLSTAPSSVETALVDSGYAHLALKQYDNARRDFESARKQETVDPVVYRALGLLAQKAGDIGQAAQNYERSVEIDPTPVGYLLLAQALEISGQRNAALAARAEAGRRSRDISRDMAIVKQLLSI
jgi:tetratricopeptide (TPR) repeat protein